MIETRQFIRYPLPLPVRLETKELDRKEVLDIVTRDISASGIFINTLMTFPEGTRFILDFTIPSDRIQKKQLHLHAFLQKPTRHTFTDIHG